MPQAAKRRFPLQMQMLAGFLIGLVAGLVVFALGRDQLWVEVVTTYVTSRSGRSFYAFSSCW